MPDRKKATLIATGVIVLALSACSRNESPGIPVPSANTTTSGVQAPKVTSPIQTATFEPTPCAVITNAQFASINLPVRNPQAKPTDSTGPQCQWNIGELGDGIVAGTFVTPNTAGLSNLYRQHESGGIKLFEELPPIEGYPAVIYGTIDARSNGNCNVAVGIRDDLTYTVSLLAKSSTFGSDPCGSAQRVAGLAVQTMTGGS